jgi:protease-4
LRTAIRRAKVLAGLDADATVKIAGYPGSSLRDVLRPKTSSQPAAVSEVFGGVLARSVIAMLDQAQRSVTGTKVLWPGDRRF